MKPSPLTLGLGLSMTVSYGTLYYSFSLLAPEMAKGLGWDMRFVFGVFSASLLAGAAAAPLTGRMIDRHGARLIMSIGTILASLSLALYALIENRWQFAAVLLFTECVAVMVQYDAGFTALAKRHGMAARSHITGVTLIAGFASTIFWPLIQHLLTMMDWRQVYLVLAGMNLVCCLPVHLSIPPLAQPVPAGKDAFGQLDMGPPAKKTALVSDDDRRRVMILLGVVFTATGIIMSAVNSSIMVLLAAMGFEAHVATWSVAMIGPSQVLARLLDLWFSDRLPATGVAVISTAAMAAALFMLLSAAFLPFAAILVGFAIVYGTGQGLNSIVKGALPLAFFGPEQYGRITGNLSGYRLAFSALAPFAIISVNDFAGPAVAIGLLTMVGMISVAAVLVLAGKDPSRMADRPIR